MALARVSAVLQVFLEESPLKTFKGSVAARSLHSPKGQCRRHFDEFQEAQDDQKNRLEPP